MLNTTQCMLIQFLYPSNSTIGFHRYVSTAQQVRHKWDGKRCGKMGIKSLDLGFVFQKTYGKPKNFYGCSQEHLPFFIEGKCYPEMVGLGSTGLLHSPSFSPFRAGIQGTSVPCHYHVLHMDKRLIQRGIAVDDIETWLRSSPVFLISSSWKCGVLTIRIWG